MHPPGFEPMLATAGRTLVGDGWAFEPKLDGWRALVHVRGGQVTVYSRPGRDMTSSVPQLAGLVDAVPDGSVLDGEIVAGSGRAWRFYGLAPQLGTKRAAVSFAAFDLLAQRRSIARVRAVRGAAAGAGRLGVPGAGVVHGAGVDRRRRLGPTRRL